jgi:hypothetical protein
MDIEESFEQLVKHKATHMADAPVLKEQATKLGLKTDDDLEAFKLGRSLGCNDF